MLHEVQIALRKQDFDKATKLHDIILELEKGLDPENIHEIPFVYRKTLQEVKKPRQYAFISGTPRSGTTALGKLLNHHPQGAIFTELYSARFGYIPQMFEVENIMYLHMQNVLASLNKHNNLGMIEKLRTASVIGDKRPNFMQSAPLTLHQFRKQKVIIIHVVRNPFEVARSFLERARKGSWAPDRDHTIGIDELNLNNRMLLQLLQAGMPSDSQKLYVLNYDTFWRSEANLRQLFELVGLDSKAVTTKTITQTIKISEKIKGRDRTLSDEERRYVEEHFDFDTHHAALAHSIL